MTSNTSCTFMDMGFWLASLERSLDDEPCLLLVGSSSSNAEPVCSCKTQIQIREREPV
jgi:hypothetical protein